MSTPSPNITVEILGKPYTIRCSEAEVAALKSAAIYVDQRMREVQASGKAINLERIAMITALNIAHDFLQANDQKSSIMQKINERLSRLQEKIDTTIRGSSTSEFIYSLE